MMTTPITSEEISKALHGMNPDKAHGPDGFTAIFYIACWDIIQKDLVKMVRKSQKCKKIGGSTNSSFLALIPKEKGAQNFSRFRPISLCNTGYKIITKVIANRIKKFFPRSFRRTRVASFRADKFKTTLYWCKKQSTRTAKERRKV